MNEYEAKQEARRQRYLDRAERAESEAQSTYEQARDMASVIPFGQPILVGHHSEGRDRRYRDRIGKTYDRAFEAHDKAGHYAAKAESVGKGGISSDDPDAVAKLKAKIAKAEALQVYMKGVNKAIRAAYKAGIREDGPAEDIAKLVHALNKATGREHDSMEARTLMRPDFAGRRGCADYELTNNNANIRRMKQRVAQLEASAGLETTETEHSNGIRVVENAEANRLQIFFPSKPSAEVRAELKSRGFRWARSEGAWQRHLNNAARFAADCVLKSIS